VLQPEKEKVKSISNRNFKRVLRIIKFKQIEYSTNPGFERVQGQYIKFKQMEYSTNSGFHVVSAEEEIANKSRIRLCFNRGRKRLRASPTETLRESQGQ
jgi:hypothetical protein